MKTEGYFGFDLTKNCLHFPSPLRHWARWSYQHWLFGQGVAAEAEEAVFRWLIGRWLIGQNAGSWYSAAVRFREAEV